jgi:choline dehydrogenase-like flavoprotein
MAEAATRYANRDEVDFVIVGSGSAGGIMAKELSTAGFTVVVLEQGPHLTAADFRHDEWGIEQNNELTWSTRQGRQQHSLLRQFLAHAATGF